MSPEPQTDTLKMQELIKQLVDLLDPDDIADGCYEGLPIMAHDPYTGKTYRIVGVSDIMVDGWLGAQIVLTEA